MKGILIAAAMALGAIALAGPSTANAQDVRVRVGPGYHHGHYYGDRYRHRHWRGHRAERCRVVVRHTWRHGRRVTVRTRTCR